MTKEFKTLLTYFSRKKGLFVLSLVLSFLQTASLVPVALLIQRIFDHALPARDLSSLVYNLLFILALFCFNAVTILGNRSVTLKGIKAAIHEMRLHLLSQTLSWTRPRLERTDLAKVQAHIVNDTERVDMMVSAFMTQLLPGALVAVGLGGVLLYQNRLLFFVVSIAMPLLYVIGKLISITTKRLTRIFHEDFSTFSKGVLFTLTFNELIKISTAEDIERDRQDENIRRVRFSSQRMAFWGTLYTIVQSNILMIAGMIVLLVGGRAVIEGTMTVGALLSFYITLNLLSNNARLALSAVPTMIEGTESLTSLMPLFIEEPTLESGTPFLGLNDAIRFDHVSFSYDGQHEVIHDACCVIHAGQTFGIFGASGSGKSTLINLLLGFYQPGHGRIDIDGRSLDTIDLKSYRQRIGVLMQDPQFFPGTIRENLTYGLGSIGEKKLRGICALCEIDEHVQTLTEGYDADMGERGTKLSGGQKQRLAIARALLREPQILILDEPDNNLDETMFVRILKRIQSLHLTIILISHDRTLSKHLDASYDVV